MFTTSSKDANIPAFSVGKTTWQWVGREGEPGASCGHLYRLCYIRSGDECLMGFLKGWRLTLRVLGLAVSYLAIVSYAFVVLFKDVCVNVWLVLLLYLCFSQINIELSRKTSVRYQAYV